MRKSPSETLFQIGIQETVDSPDKVLFDMPGVKWDWVLSFLSRREIFWKLALNFHLVMHEFGNFKMWEGEKRRKGRWEDDLLNLNGILIQLIRSCQRDNNAEQMAKWTDSVKKTTTGKVIFDSYIFGKFLFDRKLSFAEFYMLLINGWKIGFSSLRFVLSQLNLFF